MDCSWQRARAATRLRFLQQFDVADLAIIQEHGLDAASTEHVSAPMTTRRARHTSQCCPCIGGHTHYRAWLAISSCIFANSWDACAALRVASAKYLQCSAVRPDMGCFIAAGFGDLA